MLTKHAFGVRLEVKTQLAAVPGQDSIGSFRHVAAIDMLVRT